MRFWRTTLCAVLTIASLARASLDDSSYHFSDTSAGRAAWVVDESSLPWIGSYEYISSDISPSTILMTVVDSSTGSPLGECSAMNTDDDDWEHFVWTLSADSLQCNVSETNSSRVRFPLSAHPRTFSVRIQSLKGPRCLRELTVLNEKPIGCPPHLRRNAFTAHSLICGCPHVTESHAESEGDNPEFPIFELGSESPPTQETPAWTVSPCANVQCINNGTCVVGAAGEASCLCQSGFSGSRCQVDVCSAVPCAHGGRCRAEGSTAVCECPPHTKGILCEQVICEPACAQGECSLVDGAPMCECNQGFIGPNCNVIDVCIGDAACVVFGEHAKCTLDDASFTTVSTKLINATYDCHCPHPQTGQWMDCMALVLSSTISPGHSGSEVSPTMTSASSEEFSSEFTTSTTPSSVVQLGSHVVATEISPFSVQTSFISTSTTQTPTQTVDVHQPSHIVPVSTMAPESEEEESVEESTVSAVFPTMSSVVPPAVVPSFKETDMSSTFPTPAPMDISEVESQENIGAGFESSVAEITTKSFETTTTSMVTSEEEDDEEETTTVSNLSGQQTMLPMLPFGASVVTQESTPALPDTQPPFWPNQNMANLWTTVPTTITEQPTTQMTASSEEELTTQSLLPFWMMSTQPTIGSEEKIENRVPIVVQPTTTTTEAIQTEQPVEESKEEEEEVETPIEQPQQPVTDAPWPTTTTDEIEDTTKHSVAGGTANQGGTSTTSWIIAIVSIIVLGLVLLLSALFVLRYIRQSRKLHGKYNPAREEHALSAAYSLPMTHVTKEERLI